MNNSVNYKLKYLNNKKLYNHYKQQDGGMDFFSSMGSRSNKTSDIKKLLVKVIENAYDNDKIDEIIQKKLDKKEEKDYKVKDYTYVKEVIEILKQIFARQHDSKIIEKDSSRQIDYELENILKDLIEVQESEKKFVQSNFPTRKTFINKYKIENLKDKDILHDQEKDEPSKSDGSKTEL